MPTDGFCVVQVCRQPPWWLLQMSSKQGCRWLPGQDRPPTVAWWTALPRFFERKVRRLCGKEQEVCKRALITKGFPVVGFATEDLFSFLSSSCISIFSSVWCNSGDLWATAEMVLRGLRGSVSMWCLNLPGTLKLCLVLCESWCSSTCQSQGLAITEDTLQRLCKYCLSHYTWYLLHSKTLPCFTSPFQVEDLC